MPDSKATPTQVRDFFSDGAAKVELKELLELKKSDPDGYDQIATGIGNGSFTY